MQTGREHLLPRPYTVEKSILTNGVVFLHEREPNAPFVALHIASRIGSVADPFDKAGCLNLAGNLLEAGTEHYSEDEIAQSFESRGASLEIDVSKDLLTIGLTSLTNCFAEDVALLWDLLNHPTFPQEAFEREREVVRMTILEREDDPLSSTIRLFREKLYGMHPYGISSLGTLETIDRIHRNDVAEAIWTCLQPRQLVVSLVGGGEIERNLLCNYFENYQGRGEREVPRPAPLNQTPIAQEPIVVERDRETATVLLGYRASRVTDPVTAPFRVLDSVMGGAMDSRLFQEIREKRGLAYQVGTSLVSGRESGHFAMYVLTTPDHITEVIDIGRESFGEVTRRLIPDDELERSVRYMLGTGLMSLETRAHRASQYGNAEAMGLGYEEVFEFPKRIANVQSPDVQQVAERYLCNDLVVISRPPLQKEDCKPGPR